MTSMNAAQAKEMLLYVANSIIAAKPLLTEVDGAIGDGDHGIGMETGMKKARDKLLALTTTDVFIPFQITGKTMLMSMGGASGVIFGSMFLAGAKGKTPKTEMDAASLAGLFHEGLLEIQARGKANVGDKTMVDALFPAVDALEAYQTDGLLPALIAAEEAAKKGMENTKQFEARFGRSKTQSSTIGFQDAGATSVWIIFRAMKEYVQSIQFSRKSI